jgi:hypothetical protein
MAECGAAALALGGCGDRTIDGGKAGKFLVGKGTTEATVVSAHCPSGVKAKAGASFDCSVKLSNGASGTWTLDVVNKDGLVSASPSNLNVNGPAGKPSGKPVGSSVVQSAPGGGKVRVTVVAFQPRVAEQSGSLVAKRVFGVVLRLENVGTRPVSAKRPTYYALVRKR